MTRSALLLALTLAACGAPETVVDCSDTRPVEGVITLGPTLEIVGGDLLVRGTAEHPDGLTIRSVDVAGVPADNLDFNFSRWEALVPFDQVQTLDLDQSGRATLLVTARDVCGDRTVIDTFTVTLDPRPGVNVDRLELDIVLPGTATYLPVTGAHAAIVHATANPDAAGAPVRFNASVGQLDGATGTLLGDGILEATATTLLTSTSPGTSLVTASAQNQLAQTSVTFAGPPALIPAGGSVAVGQTLRLTVFTEGEIASCQATPVAGVLVTSGQADITAVPSATDLTGDGRVDIDVTVGDGLLEDATLNVVCTDVFGQPGTGEYTLLVPAE
jgi:hypothetical protein